MKRFGDVTRLSYVSIHAPARGATQSIQYILCHLKVSIHAPAKGATINSLPDTMPKDTFQSTLPRRERPQQVKADAPAAKVSIHAPAKGATSGWDGLPASDPVSIHAPAKGATRAPWHTYMFLTSFNPRSREGSDRKSTQISPLNQLFLLTFYTFSLKMQLLKINFRPNTFT